jgi:murein DD-endopeptidase MepM/ murein hydrolase activator NlpD
VKQLLFLLTILFAASCMSAKQSPQENKAEPSPHPFPTETYYPSSVDFRDDYKNDTVYFHLNNSLMCPITVRLREDASWQDLHTKFGRIILREKQDTIIKMRHPGLINFKPGQMLYIVRYGDLDRRIAKTPIAFPFPQGKEYKIIQGYNDSFSHDELKSRYAIDFSLQIGDTVTSADDGYVVGVIQDYRHHGNTQQWRENDKSNYITIYHPHSGLFTQYVHLHHKGALVKVGDYVTKRHPIGISGMTGFTNVAHLHFNVKYPTEAHDLVSTDIDFENGISGKDLKKEDWVK